MSFSIQPSVNSLVNPPAAAQTPPTSATNQLLAQATGKRPVQSVIDAVKISGDLSSIKPVSAVNSKTGAVVTGTIMWGRTPKGAPVFFLKTAGGIEALETPGHKLIGNLPEAEARAKQLLATGAVKDAAAKVPKSTEAGPASVSPVFWSAVGNQKPLSSAASALLAKRVPGVSKLLAALQPNNRGSDFLRVEANTTPDGGTVAHVKLNVSDLLKLPKPNYEAVFKQIASMPGLSAQEKVALAYYQKVLQSPGWSKANSSLAKNTDMRLTFDLANPKGGFRLGLMTIAPLPKLGRVEPVLFVSPRLKFDGKTGQPIGGQLLFGAEADTPTSKSGWWAGVGAGGVAQWDSSKGQSPIRRNAKGELGAEVTLNSKRYFVPIPGIADMMKAMPVMGDPKKAALSSAPGITAENYARVALKTDDPKVIAALEKGVETAEKTGDVLNTAQDVTAATSLISTGTTALKTLGAGPAATAVFTLAATTIAAWALLPSRELADGTINGAYATTSKKAQKEMQSLEATLSQEQPLTPFQRSQAKANIDSIEKLGKLWRDGGMYASTGFEQTLDTKLRYPWSAAQIAALRQSLAAHK